MRYINLNQRLKKRLEQEFKTNIKSHQRIRIQSILLSNQGIKIKKIAEILNVSTKSIYRWLDAFDIDGFDFLFDKEGRGTKAKINYENYFHQISEYIKTHSIKETAAMLSEKSGKNISVRMLKRFIKKKDIPIKELRKS